MATSDNIRTRERDTWNTRLSRRLNNNSLGVSIRQTTATKKCWQQMCWQQMFGHNVACEILLSHGSTHPPAAATTIAVHFTTRMLGNMLLHFAHVCGSFVIVSLIRWGELSDWTLELSLLFQFQSFSSFKEYKRDWMWIGSIRQAVFCNIKILFIQGKQ